MCVTYVLYLHEDELLVLLGKVLSRDKLERTLRLGRPVHLQKPRTG